MFRQTTHPCFKAASHEHVHLLSVTEPSFWLALSGNQQIMESRLAAYQKETHHRAPLNLPQGLKPRGQVPPQKGPTNSWDGVHLLWSKPWEPFYQTRAHRSECALEAWTQLALSICGPSPLPEMLRASA